MCFSPNSLPFASRRRKSPEFLPAGDDHDIPDAGIHQRLNGVVNHGPVVDRQQVFVGDFGQRKQPAPRPAREHDALHNLHHTIRVRRPGKNG